MKPKMKIKKMNDSTKFRRQITGLFKPFGTDLTHKSAKSPWSILFKPRDKMTKENRTSSTINCCKLYIRQSGRHLHFYMHEHHLVVKSQERSWLISKHMENCKRTFDWRNVGNFGGKNTTNTRELLKACHSSQSAVNK